MREAIVLNRMYAGGYLSSNLGHEIINLFAADDGNHYLYLNATGDFAEAHQEKFKYMLLTMQYQTNVLEVLGMAELVEDVYKKGAGKKMVDKKKSERAAQKKYIIDNQIKYGKVPLMNIFSDAEQQDVFISFRAEHLFVPSDGKRVFIAFNILDKNGLPDEDFLPYGITDKGQIVIKHLTDHKMAKSNMYQFFYPVVDGKEYESLEKLICNKAIWTEYKKKVVERDLLTPTHTTSLFDICMLQNSELAFSNALYYFLQRPEYKDLWIQFFSQRLGCQLTGLFRVTREEHAKIDDDKPEWKERISGGRMDLFIRDNSTYVIIENKIKSDINSIEIDKLSESKTNQLVRYWNYAHWLAEEHETKKGNVYACVLRPNYSHVDISNSDYQDITYNDLYGFLSDHYDVFAKDVNFVAFFEAIKRHTFDTVSEYMKHEMEEKFYSRIKETAQ